MATLVACPTCKRHARRTEERCPFCGVAISPAIRSAKLPVPPPGLSRAKLYALHAAIVTGVATSCGGTLAHDAGAPDAGADSPPDSAFQFGDGAVDAGPPDVVADVHNDIIIPPPPYGCVFPEACGDVKV
jgi:hypothetical protein